MPQPALRVRPASRLRSRMPCIESGMVPDTVQLMVEVAGLCSRAPAFEMIRPAGIAPLRNAHRKRSYHLLLSSPSSTSASARATRWKVPSISRSIGLLFLSLRRYFLSQISSEAGWSRILTEAGWFAVLSASMDMMVVAVLIGVDRFWGGSSPQRDQN